MKPPSFHRLHSLRMENDAVRFAMDEERERFETMRDRHANGTAPQAVAVHQLFQTPPALAAELVALLPAVAGGRVLEPSAGLGRILDALQPLGAAEVVAVELALECARELFRQERPGVTLLQRDFLALDPDEVGHVDAVAMNPPFTMRADIRHILHALRFLRPGGTLAALCMDTAQRETALRPMAKTWRHIPAGTFSKEGTGVGCVLLSIEKPSN